MRFCAVSLVYLAYYGAYKWVTNGWKLLFNSPCTHSLNVARMSLFTSVSTMFGRYTYKHINPLALSLSH